MKKVVLAICLLCGVTAVSQAQDFAFKRFRVDLGGGYGIPFTEGLDGGALFYLEPKFEVIPQVSVGLRWDGTLFAGASVDADGGSGGVKLSSGFLATGDYHFTNTGFRPFAGGGLGMYSVAGASVSVNVGDNNPNVNADTDASNNFALMLRAGFDVAHWRLVLSYNAAFADETFHYLGITVGWYIGGGKK